MVMWIAMGMSLGALVYALILRSLVLSNDKGSDTLQEVWSMAMDTIRTYIGKQARITIVAGILLTFVCAASVLVVAPGPHATTRFGESAQLWTAVGRGLAFLIGAVGSYAVRFIGLMLMAGSSVRVAAASEKGYARAMQVAYRTGAMNSILTVGLIVLLCAGILVVFGRAAADILLCTGAGGIITTLTLIVGGRGFRPDAPTSDAEAPPVSSTEAAGVEVATDMVRTGVALGTGIFSLIGLTITVASFAGLIIGAQMTAADRTYDMRFALYPVLIMAVGVIATLVGTLLVKTNDQRRNARATMSRGFFISAGLSLAGSFAMTFFVMRDTTIGDVEWRPFMLVFVGIVLAIAIERVTYTFSPIFFNPYKKVDRSSLFAGMVMGRIPNIWLALVAVCAIAIVFTLHMGEPAASRWPVMVYGIALIGIGMLTLTGSSIAIDVFGTITHAAHSLSNATNLSKNARNAMEDMDEVGAMSKGTAKGIIVGSAGLTAVALAGALLVLFSGS